MSKTLWTLQHEAAFHSFTETGVLRANEEFLFCGNEMRFAYDWISSEMKRRIGLPPEGVQYPVWAWYQWEGQRRRRDLRCSGYATRGTPMVQITFEVEDNCVLLSDFDAWNIVLSNQYVAANEADWDQFYRIHPFPVQADVAPSWARIFDLQRHSPNWDYSPDQKSIQATLWQIERSQVKKVEHFIAK